MAKESKGPYFSDEAFKMSLTDALSVAMKMLGVGANIYSGGNDYGKDTAPSNRLTFETISESQAANLCALMEEVNANKDGFLKYMKITAIESMPSDKFDYAVIALEGKRGQS